MERNPLPTLLLASGQSEVVVDLDAVFCAAKQDDSAGRARDREGGRRGSGGGHHLMDLSGLADQTKAHGADSGGHRGVRRLSVEEESDEQSKHGPKPAKSTDGGRRHQGLVLLRPTAAAVRCTFDWMISMWSEARQIPGGDDGLTEGPCCSEALHFGHIMPACMELFGSGIRTVHSGAFGSTNECSSRS